MSASVAPVRPCTRCEGPQLLVAGDGSMGVYRCEVCLLRVGFDLTADPCEWLAHRGLPWRYDRDRWGRTLAVAELRLGRPELPLPDDEEGYGDVDLSDLDVDGLWPET